MGSTGFLPGFWFLSGFNNKQREKQRNCKYTASQTETTSCLHKSKFQLQALKHNIWIDRATRVIFVEFTIYNANVNKFCISKLIVEVTPTGGIVTSHNFRVVKLLEFISTTDYILFLFEIIFILQIIWYTKEEIQEMRAQKFRYLRFFWNWIDLFIILIAYLAIGFAVFRYIYVIDKLGCLKEHPDTFLNFDQLSFWQLQYVDFTAICVFLIWVKILKYLKFNKILQQFSATLSRVN